MTRDEVTASNETTASGEDLTDPDWLTPSEDTPDVRKFGNDACLRVCGVPHLSYLDADLEAATLEHQTLLHSLSPGMRAVYLGGIRDRGDALEKKWAREKAEREQDETEYAAFIKEHLRRLSEDRSSRK
jgi:hypothetical protein